MCCCDSRLTFTAPLSPQQRVLTERADVWVLTVSCLCLQATPGAIRLNTEFVFLSLKPHFLFRPKFEGSFFLLTVAMVQLLQTKSTPCKYSASEVKLQNSTNLNWDQWDVHENRVINGSPTLLLKVLKGSGTCGPVLDITGPQVPCRHLVPEQFLQRRSRRCPVWGPTSPKPKR